MEKIKHDGIITRRKISEEIKLIILEVPYKRMKKYFATRNEEEKLNEKRRNEI